MNHIYRVVYNTASQTYQAVPEISKGKHKSCAEKTSAAASKTPTFAGKLRALCAALLALTCPFALAAPTGGAVSAGQAAIHQAGNITDIRQSSQNAAINWQNFSIGAHETVNFHQPNAQSLTLNRVIGNERSIIDGAMNANGKVFISNPNGMLIGRDAQINVGSLVATTAQISNDDFMNGRYQFTNAKGEIENLGNITVPQGGVVALIAPIVKHSGTITAPKAHTLLASADSFSITLPDNANFAYTLDKGTLQGLVDNGGAILADGGRVVLTAKGVDSVKKSLIKHTGVIEANTVQNNKGVIELLGDLDNSALNVSGSLKAEGKASGDGGFIETSAASLFFADSAHISTQAQNGQTGTWLIDPKDFTVAKSGGDMTGQQVTNGLTRNNITLKSRDGAKEGKGDVIINDEINWDKNTLTLNAENDIHINKTMNGSGTAKLALEYGQGTDNGGESDYYLDKNTPLKDRTAKVNLPEGKNFSVKKGSNGETIVFDVIHKMPEITNGGTEANAQAFSNQNIAFGKNIDLSHTENHNGFAGWTLKQKYKTGDNLLGGERFHGLGHIIENLTLDAPNQNDVGLIRKAQTTEIRDLSLHNSQIKGGRNVGGLIGVATNSQINNVIVNKGGISGEENVGGMIGYAGVNLGVTSELSYLHSDIRVKASTDHNIGGLIGMIDVGSYDAPNMNIHHATSFSNVNVAGSSNLNGGTGGLVGRIHLTTGSGSHFLSDSSAKGNVIAPNAYSGVGGLVGYIEQNGKQSIIQNSHATGKVEGAYLAGGLVGRLQKTNISNSFATGDVSGSSYGGGLVGDAYDKSVIENSYATGNVTANKPNNSIGGLVGSLSGSQIKRSYAEGNLSVDVAKITSANSVIAGGLVGYARAADIKESYATGNIETKNIDVTAGGLIGTLNGKTNVENSYATGSLSSSGTTRAKFGGLVGEVSDLESTISNTYATGSIHIQDLVGYKNFYKPGGLISYNSYGKKLAGVENSYFDKDTVGVLESPLGGEALSTSDMKKQANFQDWDFNKIWRIDENNDYPRLKMLTKGTIVIAPTPNLPGNPTPPSQTTDLAIKANDLSKVYDGRPLTITDANDPNAPLRNLKGWNGNGVSVTGLLDGDTLDNKNVFSGSLRFDGKGSNWVNAVNAGTYTLVPTGLTGGQKYEIKYGEGKLTIDKRPVKFTLSGEKIYDGKDSVEISLTTNKTNQEGILDKDLDKVTIQGTGTLTSKNAGVQQIKSVSNTLIGGELGGNYKLSDEIVGRWVIHKRPVTLNLSGEKVYDGTNTISVLEKANTTNQQGILDSELDKITFNGSGSLTGTNVGTHQLQSISETVIAGELGKNYEISKVGGQWQINKKPIAITATRIYDGTNNAISEEADNNTIITNLQNKLVTADRGKLSNGNPVTIVGQGTLSTKNAGDKIKVSDTGTLKLFALTPADKAIMDNYELDLVNSHWTIKPADLVVTAVSDKKVYDGTQNSNKKPTIVGLKDGDTAEFGQRFTNKNVQGENNTQLFIVDGKIVDGNNGKNYTIIDKNAKGTITPAELTITAVSDKKTYDGTHNSNKKPVITGLKGNDTAEFGQRFDDRNVRGENQSEISVANGNVVDGNNGNNYSIYTKKTKGTIEPRELKLIGKAKDIESPSDIDSLKGCMFNCYNAEIDMDSLKLIGLQGNDTIDVTIHSATYVEKPYAGDDKPVSVDWSISGQYAKNYTEAGSNVTGRITPRTFGGKALCFIASACGMKTDTMTAVNEHMENYMYIMYFSTRKLDLSTQLKGFLSSDYSEKAIDDADFKNHPFMSTALWGVALLGDGASTVGNVVSYPFTFVKGQISTGINETKKVKGLSEQQAESYEKIAHLTVDLINIYYSVASPKDVDLTGTYEQANERFTIHLAEQTYQQLEEFGKAISSFPPEQQKILLSNPLMQKVLSGSFKANEAAATKEILADSLGLINDLIQAGLSIDEVLSQNEQ